mmetsp:Transcript_14213/g.36144  ORF Transcript_14213/g.36144 Transcript_14213/m.36144 type:complete len:209 (+) Transcript_14213:74-700(+)
MFAAGDAHDVICATALPTCPTAAAATARISVPSVTRQPPGGRSGGRLRARSTRLHRSEAKKASISTRLASMSLNRANDEPHRQVSCISGTSTSSLIASGTKTRHAAGSQRSACLILAIICGLRWRIASCNSGRVVDEEDSASVSAKPRSRAPLPHGVRASQLDNEASVGTSAGASSRLNGASIGLDFAQPSSISCHSHQSRSGRLQCT